MMFNSIGIEVTMFSYPMQVDGTLTRILQAGMGGEPVILVHGTGTRADRWVRNLEPLAEAGFRIYAIDLPGHGFAEKSGSFDHSVSGYASFLSSFIEKLDAAKVTIVGTSLGGHVAAVYATLHPNKINGLVLVGSMGLVPVGEEMRLRIQAGATNQTRDFIAQKLRRVMADPALVTESFIDEEFRFNNSPGAADALRKLGQYIATDLDKDVVGEKLNQLPADIPILLIWGDQDKTVPLTAGLAAHKLIPRSRLAVLKGAAHTSYFEDPLSFNQVLIDFMQGRLGKHHSERVEYL
jgi:2-hydroxy-6-oxonona-2,4-dienedioate hydrolase